MQATAPQLVAHPLARDGLLLRARHRLRGRSTATLSRDGRLAGGTGARVAQQRARVRTAGHAMAHLATTVRHIVPVVRRILLFAAKAKVLVRHLGS